jgi:hypothetical protein
MLMHIPLFALLLVAYNITMLTTADMPGLLGADLFTTPLVSGANWQLNVSDLFVIFGLLCLYLETLKSTRIGIASVIDHSLSTLVFVIFLIEFLLLQGCGTSTFFILTLMSLLDVISGFTVSITAARRDLAIGPQ